MQIIPIDSFISRHQARLYAVEWQYWVSLKNLSYSELAQWHELFTELGVMFDLTDEFKENCII